MLTNKERIIQKKREQIIAKRGKWDRFRKHKDETIHAYAKMK